MKAKSKMLTLPCGCKCGMFVVEKSAFEDGGVYYNISIQESRYDHGYHTLWGGSGGLAPSFLGGPSTTAMFFWRGRRAFKNWSAICRNWQKQGVMKRQFN